MKESDKQMEKITIIEVKINPVTLLTGDMDVELMTNASDFMTVVEFEKYQEHMSEAIKIVGQSMIRMLVKGE